jgi:hypothetical protein
VDENPSSVEPIEAILVYFMALYYPGSQYLPHRLGKLLQGKPAWFDP